MDDPEYSMTIRAVREAIAQRLDNGRPPLCTVAGELHVSARTLQRRLSGAGWTYKQLVDDVRFSMARLRVASANVPLKAVATELGFAEQASFTRAFQRWAGVGPREYRRRLLALARPAEPA